MFASRAQIEELTDLKMQAAQIRWLTNRGYKFEVGASGHPKVLIAEIEKHMLSGSRKTPQPNFKAAA